MSDNKQLTHAKKSKNDEFYTQLSDIESELYYYKKHFKNKTVLCNCDDPRVSNFFRYFLNNFMNLGIKKLITTCYKNPQVDLFGEIKPEQPVWLEYDGSKNNSIPGVEEIGMHPLKGSGDFRSKECIKFLKKSDIVVTNPPFSLFRDHMAQLIEHKKKFLVIGNKNAIHYKDIFPLIKNNKVWLGYTSKGGMNFMRKTQMNTEGKIENKTNLVPIGAVWFTNMDYEKRHEDLILDKKYTPEKYPKYDNYDAINVDKTKDIPIDYKGKIGVPDTFMIKYNPDQFEILGLDTLIEDNTHVGKGFSVNGKLTYSRIIIKHKRLVY